MLIYCFGEKMFPYQIVTFAQLRREGLDDSAIKNLFAKLKIFPTPFKGIYYAPGGDERGGWTISSPTRVLTHAIRMFLGDEKFYYTGLVAEQHLGIIWQPSSRIDIVNPHFAGRINLRERIERNEKKTTFRAKKIARILEFYGQLLVFHKVKEFEKCKFKPTPQGNYAMRGQVKKDRERFWRRDRKRESRDNLLWPERERMTMKDIESVRKKLADHKADLASRFGIRQLGIFGSYARGQQKKGSDIDLLVTYKKTPGFFGLVRAENYLSELLGIKVDLVIDEDLHPAIAKRISKEVVAV